MTSDAKPTQTDRVGEPNVLLNVKIGGDTSLYERAGGDTFLYESG